jgi:hypothetical protein
MDPRLLIGRGRGGICYLHLFIMICRLEDIAAAETPTRKSTMCMVTTILRQNKNEVHEVQLDSHE